MYSEQPHMRMCMSAAITTHTHTHTTIPLAFRMCMLSSTRWRVNVLIRLKTHITRLMSRRGTSHSVCAVFRKYLSNEICKLLLIFQSEVHVYINGTFAINKMCALQHDTIHKFRPFAESCFHYLYVRCIITLNPNYIFMLPSIGSQKFAPK